MKIFLGSKRTLTSKLTVSPPPAPQPAPLPPFVFPSSPRLSCGSGDLCCSGARPFFAFLQLYTAHARPFLPSPSSLSILPRHASFAQRFPSVSMSPVFHSVSSGMMRHMSEGVEEEGIPMINLVCYCDPHGPREDKKSVLVLPAMSNAASLTD